MGLSVADVAPIRQLVEDRRNDWLADLDAYALGPKEKAVLEARCQELAWVLRILDGQPS